MLVSTLVIAIFVDADACPVKDETYVVGTRYGLPVVLVANSRMHVPEGFGVELVVVEQGPDAADDWIADNVRPGDVVVTADLPLAARCLEAGARALGTNGRAFSADSIGDLVATRDLKAHLRETGMASGGPPPISDKDRSRFLSKLDELVNASLREERADPVA
ncbi:MAG: YaiI/YqxD family protein [Myxococcota bacterium]|nr:YaiI/YqxD family protein [Myxococcota bacterium]